MKVKTRRGLAKRVKVTASGRLKHKKQGLRHILTKKSSKRKRQLRKHKLVESAKTERRTKTMLQG